MIVGDGPLRDRLESAAAPLGEHVIFAGYRTDVVAVLDGSDVLVQPSLWEAFPTTILEAMAAEVPVVASAVGGIPEIIDDSVNGLLIGAPPHPAALAEALAGLLADPAERRRLATGGESASTPPSRPFQWSERLRDVYDRVLCNGAASG